MYIEGLEVKTPSLIDRGFSGEGEPPELTDEIRVSLAERYIELFRLLTGKEFVPSVGDVNSRIKNNLKQVGLCK